MSLKVVFKRRVGSRADISKLPKLDYDQFLNAMYSMIPAKNLEEILTWCDKELIGWFQLELFENEKPVIDAWAIQNMDDGIFFQHGSTEPMGIGMSQTYVSDEEQDRVTLVEKIQSAMDDFESPEFQEWKRDK